MSCGRGALDVATGVKAPGVVAVGVAFAVVEEEDVDEERSERPTARRKRSLSAIAMLRRLLSSNVEDEVRIQRRGSRDLFLLVRGYTVGCWTGLD